MIMPMPEGRMASRRKTTVPLSPLTDLSTTFVADEPPPERPGLYDLPPRREYTVFSREDWEARPPSGEIDTVELPAVNVVYTAEFHEYTPACRTREECVKSMKHLQALYMDIKHLPDIPYNFVVAGDGNVYEGRGWNKVPHKSVKYPEYKEKTIDIGMITHFVYEPLNKRVEKENDLFNVLFQFIQDHLDDKLISNEYTLAGFTGKRKY